MSFSTIAQIEEANKKIGGHWFDADSKRFFNSIAHDKIYNGNIFLSTEKNNSRYNDDKKRYFTVRCAFDNGDIETLGNFQGFATKGQAEIFIESLPKYVVPALQAAIDAYNTGDNSHFENHLIDPSTENTFCGACQWLIENIKTVQPGSGFLTSRFEGFKKD